MRQKFWSGGKSGDPNSASKSIIVPANLMHKAGSESIPVDTCTHNSDEIVKQTCIADKNTDIAIAATAAQTLDKSTTIARNTMRIVAPISASGIIASTSDAVKIVAAFPSVVFVHKPSGMATHPYRKERGKAPEGDANCPVCEKKFVSKKHVKGWLSMKAHLENSKDERHQKWRENNPDGLSKVSQFVLF